MALWIKSLMFVVALINMVPVVGVLSRTRLEQLYQIDIVGNDLLILLQHRAVMLGLIGGLLMLSTWVPALRVPAAYACLISMVSFVLITLLVGGASAAIIKVAWVDVFASIALAVALVGLHLTDAKPA